MNAALILTAIFNGAWQGAALCALAVFAFRFFRRLNATTMFTVWSVLLAITVLLPFANYTFARKPYLVVHTVTAMSTVRTPLQHVQTREVPQPRSLVHRSAPADVAGTLQAAAKSVFRYAPQILLVLALLALVRLAILGRDIVRMLVARARVRPIDAPVTLSGDIARPFGFAASHEFTSPCVLGFAPALIVIPEQLLEQAGSELTSVILHEREHVRRFDDIQNVVQRFIGAIAFFCLGVRIALRELALYREQICDDAAVNATGDRISYAMTLTDLAQWAQGRGTPVPSLIFKRKHLLHRLEVLLDSAVNHSMRMNRRFALGAVCVLALAAALVLRIQVPVIAETIVHLSPAPQAHRTATPTHHAVHHASVRKPSKKVTAPANDTWLPGHGALLHVEKPKARAMYEVADAVAFAGAYRRSDAAAPVVTAPVFVQPRRNGRSNDLLSALATAGLENLPVDQLIALRDHGVGPDLVRSASSYFGHVSADDLTYLADHGVGTSYIETLRAGGIAGIRPQDAVMMMEHGVGSALIRAALSYFDQRPGVDNFIFMADHGIGASYIDTLRAARISVCWQDALKMLDNGIDAAYVAKIRKMNPHATIAEIVRLHNAGF